jgi:uncharacterized OB-fold protein
MVEQVLDFTPALPIVKVDPQGRHWLAGSRCGQCQVVVAGERMACPACGARDALAVVRLSDRGVLHTFTVVHRSVPGVATPFVAAVVDLDGGGALKGTLLNVEPDPAKLPRHMPIRIVFRDTQQKDKEGKPFLCYFFTPATGVPA